MRKQYVADIKASLRGHLNNISIVEKDGSSDRSWKEIRKCWKNRKLILEKKYEAS